MDKEINDNSKKFLILLLIICLTFFVLIIKAFEHIPQSVPQSTQTKVETVNNQPAEAEPTEVNREEEQANAKPQEVHFLKVNRVEEDIPTNNTEEALEPISDVQEGVVAENAPQAPELTPEQKFEEIFAGALKYKQDKQYVKALEELQKAASLTSDSSLITKSYEEIAIIYATVKRYGTALSFAQKAYNMSPSSSREVLLARLYYKTGNIDKATQRVNNVLQRDFSADRD